MPNDRLKLLVVSTSISPPAVLMRGTKTVYNLQKELSKKGLEIHILTHISNRIDLSYQKWFERQKEKWGITFHYFHFPQLKKLNSLNHLFSAFYYIIAIRQLQKKYHFDIIHEYTSTPILFYRASFYRNLGVKKIFHTIQTYNETALGNWFWGKGIKYLGYAIGVTRDMVSQLKKHQPKYQNKILFIPLGLSSKSFFKKYDKRELRKKYNLPNDKPIVLYIGPLEKSKGALVLQKAIEKVDVFFLIVTYGPEGSSQKRIKIYQKDKDKFLKPLSKMNFKLLEGLQPVEEILALADIFVLPAITQHGTLGYPAILIEAMAAGKAIVASNLPGINELIFNKQTGLLVPPGNELELRRSINKLANNTILRQKLGKKSRDFIFNLLNKDISNTLYKLYVK